MGKRVSDLTEIDALADADDLYVHDASAPTNLSSKRVPASKLAEYLGATASFTEQIQDTAGAMFTGNTETGITITYQDADGTIDAVVADTSVTADTGTTALTPGDTLTVSGANGVSTSITGDTLTVTGTDTTIAGDTGSTAITPGDTVTITGAGGVSTAMVGDTLTVTAANTTFTGDTGSTAVTLGDNVTFTATGGVSTTITADNVSIDAQNLTVAADVGSTGMTLGDTLTAAGAGGISTNMTGDTLTVTASDLTIAGDIGSTAVTLGDTVTTTGTGGITTNMTGDTLTVAAADLTIAGDTGSTAMTLGDTVTTAGAGGISTNMTGDTLTVTAANLTVAGDTGSTGMTLGDTLTVAGGTNATTSMSGDTITVNVDDAFLSNSGDIGTGSYDFGGATSFEIPNSTTVTTDAAGEIALDTNGNGSTITTGVLQVFDGTQNTYVVSTTNYPSTDNDVPAYDSATNSVTWQAQAGGGGGGTPGGSDTQLQYNNAGSFGGDTGFTTDGAGSVNITGDLDVDNININGSVISNTSTNADLDLQPNGTGNVTVSDGTDTTKKVSFEVSGATTATATTVAASQTVNRTVTLPDATTTLVGRDTTDTLTNKTINTASNTITVVEADISDLGAYIENVVEDTTPQLGGQLDVNGNAIGDGTRELLTFTEDASAVNHVNIENQATGSGPIISAAGDDTNVDLNLSAKGTGNISLGNLTFDADQTVGAGQDNYVLTYDNTGGVIALEAAAGGGSGDGWTLESTTTLSSDTSVDFTDLAADTEYRIRFKSVVPSVSGANLILKFSDDNGSTFNTVNCSTTWGSPGTSTLGGSSSNTTEAFIFSGSTSGALARHGVIYIHSANDSTHPMFCHWNCAVEAGTVATMGVSMTRTTTDINAVRFQTTVGNMTSGEVLLFSKPGD